jgi:uncharacterized protein YlxW (UPF0749 family)
MKSRLHATRVLAAALMFGSVMSTADAAFAQQREGESRAEQEARENEAQRRSDEARLANERQRYEEAIAIEREREAERERVVYPREPEPEAPERDSRPERAE